MVVSEKQQAVSWLERVWPGFGHGLTGGMKEREGRLKNYIEIPEVTG